MSCRRIFPRRLFIAALRNSQGRSSLDQIPQSDTGYKLLNDDQPPVLFPAVYDPGYAGDRVRLKILVDIGRVYVQDLLYIKPAGITVLHQIYIVRFIDRGNNLIK
jgi:hypothetical protein